jgi:hypothetical protein
LTIVTTILTLTMCDSREKLGTYKVSIGDTNQMITLYRDSTFNETSDLENKNCEGRWITINQTDSIIEITTLSCEGKIFTITPTRTLKIKGENLIESSEFY